MFRSDGQILPKGLYSLLLFASSNPSYISSDNLTITQDKSNSKKLAIRFSHRGNDYKIMTDEKGFITMDKSFFIHHKQDESPAQNESTAEDLFSKDIPTPLKNGVTEENLNDENNFCYTGILRVKYSKKGVLSIKGKLKKQKLEPQKNTEKESPQKEEKLQKNEAEETKESSVPLLNPYLD